jgi:hypothetical protein
MMRLFVNGLAASAGGGLTYLRNVIPHLARRSDVEATVLLNPEVRREFGELPNISFVEAAASPSVFRRFVHEQTSLPGLLRRNRSQVLVSTGTHFIRRPIFAAMYGLAETTQSGRIRSSRAGLPATPSTVPTLRSLRAKPLRKT